MPKLAVVVSALFLLGGASACGTSGTSDADQTTTTAAVASTTSAEDDTTTTEEEPVETTTAPDGGDADATALAAGLAENFMNNDGSAGELAFDADQADCAATEWVNIVGADTFAANDVTPDDLKGDGFEFSELGIDKGQATDMIAALGDCDVEAISTLRDALASEYDATQQTCLDAELDDETILALLVDTLYLGEPGPQLAPELARIDELCQLQ